MRRRDFIASLLSLGQERNVQDSPRTWEPVHGLAAAFGRAVTWPLTSALLSFGIAVNWPATIKAHDIYTLLKDSSGRSCCSDHDCRPAHYRLSPAGVHMLVGGEWIVVPNAVVQYRSLEGDTGETAGGHWCGLSGGFVTVTYCAILPPSSASSTNHSVFTVK